MDESSYKWEPSPHTADLAVQISAKELPGLFHAALAGLLGSLEIDASVADDIRTVEYNLHISFNEPEAALVDFLNECIYLMEVEELVPVAIGSLKLHKNRLEAILNCRDATDRDMPEIGHIKAATYSDLQIENIDGMYHAKVIFDT
jgi:SHS2 domain-containing protein